MSLRVNLCLSIIILPGLCGGLGDGAGLCGGLGDGAGLCGGLGDGAGLWRVVNR